MKVTISYLVRETKTIEIDLIDYLKLTSDIDSRPDIFPENSFEKRVSLNKEEVEKAREFYLKNL